MFAYEDKFYEERNSTSDDVLLNAKRLQKILYCTMFLILYHVVTIEKQGYSTLKSTKNKYDFYIHYYIYSFLKTRYCLFMQCFLFRSLHRKTNPTYSIFLISHLTPKLNFTVPEVLVDG